MSATVTSVAVFDLDGTLTWRDTFIGFLRGYVRRHPGRLLRLWRVPIVAMTYLLRGFDRGLLKQQLIQVFMRGDSRAVLDDWAQIFTQDTLNRGIRAEGLRALQAHQHAGDYLVLLSASPDLYVPRIGAMLGVDRIICTQVAYVDGRLAGNLLSPNRRGEEKLRCLSALRAEFPGAVFSAYGNSGSDLVHLRAVEHPLLVNASARARRQARQMGVPSADWR